MQPTAAGGELRAAATRGCAAARGGVADGSRQRAGREEKVPVPPGCQDAASQPAAKRHAATRWAAMAKRHAAWAAPVKNPVRWEKTVFCQKSGHLRKLSVKNRVICERRGAAGRHIAPHSSKIALFSISVYISVSHIRPFLTKICLFPPDRIFDMRPRARAGKRISRRCGERPAATCGPPCPRGHLSPPRGAALHRFS